LKSSAVIYDLSTIVCHIAKTKQRNVQVKNIGKGSIIVCLSYSHFQTTFLHYKKQSRLIRLSPCV